MRKKNIQIFTFSTILVFFIGIKALSYIPSSDFILKEVLKKSR